MAASNQGYSIDLAARLLRILRENGPASKARLARLSSMGTRTLEKYLNELLIPLGMVEEKNTGKKKTYIITPLGVMASILLGTLGELFDKEKHELKKEIVNRVEEELRARGLKTRNLLLARCSLATPADLQVTGRGHSVLLYVATSGDEALVKAILGLGVSALSKRKTIVIVATPEKPCMSLSDRGNEMIHIVYYDSGSVEGAAREIAESVERVLRENQVAYEAATTPSVRVLRI